ncbi:unnamed protein product [Larinioides sclopetarius]|uniref:Uncharacterized protein n=1 Tax=Larinioides sclopetarius TaxID=280406 RepID=A0AAV2BIG9_9ARAC
MALRAWWPAGLFQPRASKTQHGVVIHLFIMQEIYSILFYGRGAGGFHVRNLVP